MTRRSNNVFFHYCADVWAGLFTTCIGMALTIRYFFSKPVTMLYPEVRPEIPRTHRGLHEFDESKCILCRLCANNCPVGCIDIESAGKGKDGMITRYDVDYGRCLFCNLCAEVCPTQCVRLTEEYSMIRGSREACVLHLSRPKTQGEIAEHAAKLARLEAEKKAAAAAAKEAPKQP